MMLASVMNCIHGISSGGPPPGVGAVIAGAGMIFGLFSPVQAMAQACVFLHLVFPGEVLATRRVARGWKGKG